MAQKSARKPKGQNGVGDSITLFFDVSDPSERRALEASKLLASKHGRRKAALVAMLDAMYRVYESSGELLSPAEIGAALMGQSSGRQPGGSMPIITQDVPTSERRGQRQHTGGVEITGSSKASAQVVADNFINSMRGLASGFFD
jgi:hypothetical protein